MAWVESPTEVRLPSPTVVVPIILARQEGRNVLEMSVLVVGIRIQERERNTSTCKFQPFVQELLALLISLEVPLARDL